MNEQFRISAAGWLMVKREGKGWRNDWMPLFKLTPKQEADYAFFQNAKSKNDAKAA